MEVTLTIATIVSYAAGWALPLSTVLLVISIILDLFKKKFYWTKFALVFFGIAIILMIASVLLAYQSLSYF